MGTLLRALCLLALTLALDGVGRASAGGLPPMRSDSACAAHVPGWEPNDYVRACAQLIARLNEIRERCARTSSPPNVPREAADPERMCSATSLGILGDQLAAAYNDRAYFLILLRGSDNYRLAEHDLDKAIGLLPKYWVAFRNRGIARMLLRKYAEAKADFWTVTFAIAKGDAGNILVQPVSQAEVRLGLGYATLGLCDIAGAQEHLFEAERLALGPIGADHWLRAAALYGQGLGLEAKGATLALVAATNRATTPSEKSRLAREAQRLIDQGIARMKAARALLPTIGEDIRDRFHIEENDIVNKCRKTAAAA